MTEHADRILAAIEAGDNVSALAASWRRSLTLHKLDPDARVCPERDPQAWLDARDRDGKMIAIARPYLEQLYRLLAEGDRAVYLSASDGMLLDLITNRPHDTWGRPREQWLGTIYSERNVGTNSIGTSLAEGRATVLRGGEHFLTAYCHLTCVGAPLFGPDGELAGALTLSEHAAAHDARLDSFLSIAVASMARWIEVEMFAAAFPKARLMLASGLRGATSALVAVDRDERVIGATHAARRVLALDAATIAAAPGFDTLFSEPADAGDALADVERRTIERALAREDGNVSAAARSMGISRSTLYRKIALYGLDAAAGPRD